MFIVSLTYNVDLSEVDQHISDHIAYLEKYYAQGKFIVSGRKAPRTGGIILVNAVNRQEVESIIQQDPFYQAELADYAITEFVPTMAAPDFVKLKHLG
ncbi:YciI family protein [Algibacillus agarilyticus]|uniref:YciI family protein n=1 Tax=Algibacillus agarilyticus TaxID=2234133 RepID=UPI000DD07B23|nr:YciI family protein [Algibacillus agarilyticus]